MATLTEQIRAARRHLRQNDAVMRVIIDQVGPYTLRPERDRFSTLVRSIISQQISISAARSIRRRLEQAIAPARISSESLLALDNSRLRSVGLSPQKAAYVHDLALKTSDGTVDLRTIGRKSDEEVIEILTQVKGIGRWTAQMFLIFALGRLDVFPADDLGIRIAIRDLYGLRELPDRAMCAGVAASWQPYSSVASWYCWRSLDLARNGKANGNGYPT
jgi:DNA-3-methyladenine glycosylase II